MAYCTDSGGNGNGHCAHSHGGSNYGALDFCTEKEEGVVTSFGQLDALRVKLDDAVTNFSSLANLLRSLLDGRKKVTRIREVLQRAFIEVRRLISTEP